MINNRTEHVAPSKSAEKFLEVRKELAELGAIKAGLLTEIDRLQKLAEEYYNVDKNIEEKTAELSDLNSKVFLYNSQILEQNKKLEELSSLDSKIIDARKTIDELSLIVSKERESLDNEIYKHSIFSSNITKEIESISNDRMEAINDLGVVSAKLVQVNNDLENVSLLNNNIKKEYEKNLQENNSILTKIEQGQKKLEEIKQEISSIKKEKEVIANKIIEQATDDAQEILKEANALIEKRNSELVLKSGELSDKARFLQIREDLLKDVKSQLEEKLGKRIDNLVF